MVENELDAYIGGFHLDALTSGVPLNVDLDTTLTVVAGNLLQLMALKLSRYEHATPETLWRDFLDATGTLHIDDTASACALNLHSRPRRLHGRAPGSPTWTPRSPGGRPHPQVPVPATMTRRAARNVNLMGGGGGGGGGARSPRGKKLSPVPGRRADRFLGRAKAVTDQGPGLGAGEWRYDDLERRLASFPAITVPAITLEGDANGAPHPDASAYASKFTGKYEHRVVEGGIGHNLPQEAPQVSPKPSSTSAATDR